MTVWQDPLHQPVLDQGQVHLWRANLDLSAEKVAYMASFLSSDEIHRANKFRFPEHKRRFMVARSILRQLLGNYLNTSASSLEFDYGNCGKPKILSLDPDHTLQFNISHSQEYALFGFTLNDLIGVDLEYLRTMPDAVKIARRFFSPREFDSIGTGLSGSLASVEIKLEPGEQIRLLSVDPSSIAASSWSIYYCIPASKYVGAIAVRKQIIRQHINFWNWN